MCVSAVQYSKWLAARQKGEAVAARREDVKERSRMLEAWQLFNDLQAVWFDWAAPTHQSIHPPLCTLQQPEHSSHIWPLSLPQTLPLLPLCVVITHKPCVLPFLFFFTISPLLSCNHKNMERSNVIDSHDLEGKRNATVPSRNVLFSSAAHVLQEKHNGVFTRSGLSIVVCPLRYLLLFWSGRVKNVWMNGTGKDFQWYSCLMGPSALQQWRCSNCYHTSMILRTVIMPLCRPEPRPDVTSSFWVISVKPSEKTSSAFQLDTRMSWGQRLRRYFICHLFINWLIIRWLWAVQS